MPRRERRGPTWVRTSIAVLSVPLDQPHWRFLFRLPMRNVHLLPALLKMWLNLSINKTSLRVHDRWRASLHFYDQFLHPMQPQDHQSKFLRIWLLWSLWKTVISESDYGEKLTWIVVSEQKTNGCLAIQIYWESWRNGEDSQCQA